MSKLKVISVESNSTPSQSAKFSGRFERTVATQLSMDRFWLQHPTKWDPTQSIYEIERLQRTFQLIQKFTPIKNLNILDLGCGEGSFSRLLHEKGAYVVAVDTSFNALKIFNQKNEQNHLFIPNQIETLPLTNLEGSTFDLIICADVIAELDHRDFRLAMSEVSRLVKPNGWVVCSTQIDCYSEDALQRFLGLFQTEFMLSEAVYSYHRCISKMKNRTLMLWLETFSRCFWQQAGITHAILLGKKKLLI